MRLAEHDLGPAARLRDMEARRQAAIEKVLPHVKLMDMGNVKKAVKALPYWSRAREATRDRAIRTGATLKRVFRELVRRAALRGGVEDPRIVQSEDGTYILTYTQWNRDVPRLAVATSRDLLSWAKHGPAFARAAGGRYLLKESKSGAILSRVAGDRVIATRVKGKYWMYWGVPTIRLATSDNLIDWTPLEDSAGQALAALAPRTRGFDSWLVEAGPPALLMPAGIVVLYNAGDSATRTYSAGQALFDRANPMRLLARSDSAFIRPTEPYERTGQYAAGTTFVEALVPFKGKWFLYYGTADSRVGVAVHDPPDR